MSDAGAIVYVVDDDVDLGASLARLMRRSGYASEAFCDPEALLATYADQPASCVLTDVMMGEVDGFAFVRRLRAIDSAVAVLFMTAWPTTAAAVDAIRDYRGVDYLEKPIDTDRLLESIGQGVAWSRRRREALRRTAMLSPREQEVFHLLVKGFSNKAIAAALGVSTKTVENHRAAITAKTGAIGLAQLIEIAPP